MFGFGATKLIIFNEKRNGKEIKRKKKKGLIDFSYMQMFTLYQLSDKILNIINFSFFFPCRLLPPHPPHLIILFASFSSFFKQGLYIGIRMKIVNKHSIRTAIKHGPAVSESLRWLAWLI